MAGMKNLKLERPLVFIDLETTGLSIAFDRIVELTVLKVHPDGTEESRGRRINPGIPIPIQASEVHGITDYDVRDEPSFSQFANSLTEFLGKCDLAGFNILRFDLPLLEAEFKRCRVEFSREGRRIIDTQVIFHTQEPRNLTAAYKKYCGKDLDGAHSSEVDVRATAEILAAQLDFYPDLPQDLEGLDMYCNRKNPNWLDSDGKLINTENGIAFGFGQYKGKLLQDVCKADSGYLEWIANGDFSKEVKGAVYKALSGKLSEL